ncbi:hypothetical protein [Bacillus cereus]|uniref:hypothetical protein n=1 Tax=Bacillus cereus TaxID=1396 RepID=UPI000BF3C2BA|nr:hypothetical protein [Bacillus cereus]PES08224.1 hypothetical protein CN494_30185 [Bacillus cereus]
MNLIHQENFNNSASISFALPPLRGMFKIVATGKLSAEGQDRHFLVRFNDQNNSYNSIIVMEGNIDNTIYEWDNTGFYIGRNGWGLDADFSMDYTFGRFQGAQKITGSGLSTFVHGNNNILGCESHGFFVSDEEIRNVQVLFTGGKVNGALSVYQL